MAENTNVIMLVGNLTGGQGDKPDVDLSTYGEGDKAGVRAEFRIAVNRRPPRGGGEGQADYFTIKVFGGLAENCQKYLAKGRKVAVVGRHQTDAVERRDGNGKAYFSYVIADRVEFLSPRGEGDAPASNGNGSSAPAAEKPKSDIPF